MANTPQAKKRVRQAEKRRQHNVARRSGMRTAIKKVLQAVSDKNKELANSLFREASSLIDKAATKGLIKKNKAARDKSRLNAKIKELA